MKKIAFLILLMPFLTFSQEKATLLGFEAGTNHSSLTNKLSNSLEGAIGFQLGFKALLPIKSEKVYFISGIQVSDFGSRYASGSLRWGSQHDGMGGFDETLEGASNDRFIIRTHSFFIDIPVGIRYYFKDKNWRWFIQPSLDFNLYSFNASQSKFTVGGQVISRDSYFGRNPGVRAFNGTGTLGIGFERKIKDSMLLGLSPYASIQLLSAAKNSTTGSRYYAFGGRMSLFFKL